MANEAKENPQHRSTGSGINNRRETRSKSRAAKSVLVDSNQLSPARANERKVSLTPFALNNFPFNCFVS